MTRAAIYLRISRDDTGEKLAIQRQREDCLEIVQKEGWTLVETYEDNSISAYSRTKKRPGYNRMEADFEAGAFDVIICYNLDRLTRQPAQLEKWIELAETRGLRIVTVTGEADLGTDDGRLFARMKASIARAEAERKGARHKRANIQKVASGVPAPGRRPFGYQNGGVIPLESEAVTIREAYKHVLDGGSLYGLCRQWNDASFLTPMGGKWSPIQVKKVLLRKRNMGVLERYGEAMPDSKIQPLVDAEIFLKVEAMLSARSTSRGGREPVRHVLTGLATCSVCEREMKGKALKVKGEPERVPFYICASRIERTEKSDGKRHPAIKAEILEEEVAKQIVAAFLFGSSDLFPAPANVDLGALHLALREAEEGRQRLIGLVTRNLITEAEATPQLAALAREQDQLQKTIADVHSRSASSLIVDIRGDLLKPGRVDLEEVVKVKKALRANYDSLTADKKRNLIKGLLKITLRTGWGLKRVDIKHLKVTSLNDSSAD